LKPYKTLQVDRDAEQEVIEAAYKRLAGKYHPDKDPSASATQRMQEINAAFEILRDPERRGRYDREQRRKRAERDRPHVVVDVVAPLPVEPKVSVEAVSDRVFLKVLGVAALLAVLAYFPWAFVILAGIWGLVWLVRRHPKGVAKIVAAGVSFAVAVGAYVWAQDWTQEAKAKDELKRLNVNDLLVDQLGKFTDGCVRTASSALQPRPPAEAATDFGIANAQRLVGQYAPPAVTGPNPLATAYCSCLADALRARFDGTPITATSVVEYRDEFTSRFQAAAPDKVTQSGCLIQVNPRPVAMPSVKIPTKPMRAKLAPAPAPVDDLSSPSWGHLEVPAPPPQIVDLDKPAQ
jgi:hypothetical protein